MNPIKLCLSCDHRAAIRALEAKAAKLESAPAPEVARRILHNYLAMMSKRYREKNPNWIVVRDLLLGGQHAGGCLYAMEECERIGVDPEGYELEGEADEAD